MLRGAPDAIAVVRKGIRLPVIAAVVLTLAVSACEPAAPPNPTVPPLTPAAAVSTPGAAAMGAAQTATPAAALPAPASRAEPPRAESAVAASQPKVSAAIVARTEERVDDLTGRMLRPRPVDTDVLWGALLTHRALGIRNNDAPDVDAPVRMLEMWHSGNPCYGMLEAEVEQLGAAHQFGPVEFNAYFDHILSQLSPCLDQQWSKVDGRRFFANSDAVRAARVSTWYDSIWDRSSAEALTELDHCRAGFYAHAPAAVSAGAAADLHTAWGEAMVEFSECRQQALRAEFPFVYLGESQMFAFELNDRYTLIALQATLGGHLIAISMQRPYDECWPEFEADIPEIALAEGPAQMAESRSAALRALRSCIRELPEYRPFGD